MSIRHATGAGRHRLVDRGADLYSTAPEAVTALLQAERLPHFIWEPCAGRGGVVRVLRDAGHAVIASDLIDYGFPLHFKQDFLTTTKAPTGVSAVITNPPYRLAAEFVAHALKLCPLAIMLLRLGFLESERRSPILDNGRLTRIHVFRNRLPMMHRDSWTGPRASSAIAFGWFVWNRDHRGPAVIDRISWSRT